MNNIGNPEQYALFEEIKTQNPTWGRGKIAELSGANPSTVGRWLARRAKKGVAPECDMTKPVPEGFSVKGVSTLYGPEGELKAQWVKTCADKENLLASITEAVEGIIEPCKGLALPVEPPAETMCDLLTVYPVADPHMGMYAWGEETGEDFDADKCEQTLTDAMIYLVAASPPSETALIANIADFFHADTAENKTMRSGNVLDVDTRWARVLQIGVRCYRTMINLALKKHAKVYVKSGIGNHDDHSILTLAMMMQAYFENEPRVEIQLPISHFAFHHFGKNLFGINHGTIKLDRLPGIMAADKSQAWGETEHRTWFVGHLHSKEVKEFPGCTVERFRTTSPKDSWTANAGFRSKRSAEAITYHETDGEVSRVIKNI